MTPKRSRMIFWLGIFVATLFVFRLSFDLKTYFYGSSVTVRAASEQGYDYLLHLPKGYHDWSAPRPLIVFLHGSGEAGKDVRVLRYHDPFRFANGKLSGEEFPFIVVSPIAPERHWNPEHLEYFLDQFLSDNCVRYKIDPTRIYLTGISMGGYGTFHVAERYPNRFAAIVPLAGSFPPKYAENLKTVPIWAFHGDRDEIVLPEESQKIIDAMQEAGNTNAQLTLLPGAGHGIAEDVYSCSELYRWMLEHSLE